MKSLSVFGVLFFFSLNIVAQTSTTTAETRAKQLYDSAQKHKANGDSEAAIKELQAAADLAPTYLYSFDLGQLYYNLRRYDAALESFKVVKRYAPEYAENYYMLGWCYLQKKDTVAATDQFLICYHYAPKSDKNLFALAVCFNAQKNYFDARGSLDQALAIRKTELYYILRAVVDIALEDDLTAINDCDLAVELEPGDFEPYMHRATAYANLHYYNRAVKDIDRAIALKPDLPMLRQLKEDFLNEMKK